MGVKNREELGERGSMSMYKDVKEKNFSRSAGDADGCLDTVDRKQSVRGLHVKYWRNIAGRRTICTDWQRDKRLSEIGRAAMKVDMDVAQSVDYTVSVYQNLGRCQ